MFSDLKHFFGSQIFCRILAGCLDFTLAGKLACMRKRSATDIVGVQLVSEYAAHLTDPGCGPGAAATPLLGSRPPRRHELGSPAG